jgi:hypothetical protein
MSLFQIWNGTKPNYFFNCRVHALSKSKVMIMVEI